MTENVLVEGIFLTRCYRSVFSFLLRVQARTIVTFNFQLFFFCHVFPRALSCVLRRGAPYASTCNLIFAPRERVHYLSPHPARCIPLVVYP